MVTLSNVIIFASFGILFVLIQVGITLFLSKKSRNSLLLQAIGLLTNFMFVFTLMWVYASILERAPQAAGMSAVFFGGTTLVLAVVFWRLVSLKKDFPALTWPSKKAAKTDVEASVEVEAPVEAEASAE